MAIRFDAADDRVYLAATLPAPASTGLTILGWWQIRVDRATFSVYCRTSGAGGTPTIHSVSTHSNGFGVSVYTTAGELESPYDHDVVDEWLGVAVVDNAAGRTLYVRPLGGSTVTQAGTVGTGTPGHFCIGGRSQSDATEWFNGNAAHVRVFSAALTQTEVEAEWASATPVRGSGLWASYPFVDNIQDASGNSRHLTAVAGVPAFEPGPDLGGGEEEPPAPFWSRVRVNSPRLVRGRSRVTSGRVTRAGRHRP